MSNLLCCPFCFETWDNIEKNECGECGDDVCNECIENGLCPDCALDRLIGIDEIIESEYPCE